MRKNYSLYKNQGIHVINSIFTIKDGKVKILLIKRKNDPYKDMWALVGGAVYNNERLEDACLRETKEKTGIENVELHQFGVYDEIGKTPSINMRMISINYLGLINCDKIKFLKNTINTEDAGWFDINDVPKLAFAHNEILIDAIQKLKELVVQSNILKALLPKEFTMPELQNIYESIFNKTYDRRNFRKKILSLNILEDTNKVSSNKTGKPAILYGFKSKIENKKVL